MRTTEAKCLLHGPRSTTQSEHRVTESAVMASEIEALPDRTGYLKFASEPVWMKVDFPVYDLPTGAKPFVVGYRVG